MTEQWFLIAEEALAPEENSLRTNRSVNNTDEQRVCPRAHESLFFAGRLQTSTSALTFKRSSSQEKVKAETSDCVVVRRLRAGLTYTYITQPRMSVSLCVIPHSQLTVHWSACHSDSQPFKSNLMTNTCRYVCLTLSGQQSYRRASFSYMDQIMEQ